MNTKSQPSHPQQQNPQIPHNPTNNNNNNNNNNINNNMKNKNNKVIWDCGSSLYDSFELDSFRKQLDSAILNSSRTLSMPRLPSDNNRAPPQPQPQPQQPSKKPTSSRMSRSFQKLLRSVFRAQKPKPDYSSNTSPDPWFFDSPGSSYEDKSGDKYYVVYEKPDINGLNGLGSIPEVSEVNVSPQIGSLARKTMSARFTASASRGSHENQGLNENYKYQVMRYFQ
ncbi:hypothetical protein RND81_08G107900 [Saponaria officinalis]|uniref:Uncharacterized protein n=1 Tax=Saponaria officinalis TaxID=3572 RepID=A0AAW1J5Z3_SAPOF